MEEDSPFQRQSEFRLNKMTMNKTEATVLRRHYNFIRPWSSRKYWKNGVVKSRVSFYLNIKKYQISLIQETVGCAIYCWNSAKKKKSKFKCLNYYFLGSSHLNNARCFLGFVLGVVFKLLAAGAAWWPL